MQMLALAILIWRHQLMNRCLLKIAKVPNLFGLVEKVLYGKFGDDWCSMLYVVDEHFRLSASPPQRLEFGKL
jgi:hypothetical protein